MDSQYSINLAASVFSGIAEAIVSEMNKEFLFFACVIGLEILS